MDRSVARPTECAVTLRYTHTSAKILGGYLALLLGPSAASAADHPKATQITYHVCRGDGLEFQPPQNWCPVGCNLRPLIIIAPWRAVTRGARRRDPRCQRGARPMRVRRRGAQWLVQARNTRRDSQRNNSTEHKLIGTEASGALKIEVGRPLESPHSRSNL